MSKRNWMDDEQTTDLPTGKMLTAYAVRVLLIIGTAGVILGVMGYALGWCNEAAQVAADEAGPKAMLAKYVWLKDAHAQLDKKKADIKVYEARQNALADQYAGVARNAWPRDDREAYNQMSAEVAGIKASYNDLAAQYNAKMAEVNWRFTNVGQLPQGATETLPREYAPYVEQ